MARTAEALRQRTGVDAYAVPHAEQSGYLGSGHYRGGSVRMDIGTPCFMPAMMHVFRLQDAMMMRRQTRQAPKGAGRWRGKGGYPPPSVAPQPSSALRTMFEAPDNSPSGSPASIRGRLRSARA